MSMKINHPCDNPSNKVILKFMDLPNSAYFLHCILTIHPHGHTWVLSPPQNHKLQYSVLWSFIYPLSFHSFLSVLCLLPGLTGIPISGLLNFFFFFFFLQSAILFLPIQAYIPGQVTQTILSANLDFLALLSVYHISQEYSNPESILQSSFSIPVPSSCT